MRQSRKLKISGLILIKRKLNNDRDVTLSNTTLHRLPDHLTKPGEKGHEYFSILRRLVVDWS
jgi:hypothetical protein